MRHLGSVGWWRDPRGVGRALGQADERLDMLLVDVTVVVACVHDIFAIPTCDDSVSDFASNMVSNVSERYTLLI